ncbi:unnamed protein product [Leptosia nina]|uniref:Uncharacterized protein n=1 Tax=Leptosia nina TaxID=320188 RepID=A0AAV1IZ71_9NEOP
MFAIITLYRSLAWPDLEPVAARLLHQVNQTPPRTQSAYNIMTDSDQVTLVTRTERSHVSSGYAITQLRVLTWSRRFLNFEFWFRGIW